MTNFDFNSPLRHRFYLFISGILSIAEGLICVISLTLYHPVWVYSWMFWYMDRQFKKQERP